MKTHRSYFALATRRATLALVLVVCGLLSGCATSDYASPPAAPAAPSETTREVTETEEIPPPPAKEVWTPFWPKGRENTFPGRTGKALVTYTVTYLDGVETKREEITRRVITEPLAATTYKGTGQKSGGGGGYSEDDDYGGCGDGYYENVDGNCVRRPGDDPDGATARCNDGTYSYSQNRRGTCSGHGGVDEWY